MPKSQAERVRSHFDAFAPKYDRRVGVVEKLFLADERYWACSHTTGDVLEIGIGTGRNLAYYPDTARVTGIDLSTAMMEIARARASELGRPADLQMADAESLPFPDERFDTVVATLSLCCVPDIQRAVAEMKRVLRSGGRLVLLDHVVSDRFPVRAVQQILEPLWNRLHADSLLRRPLEKVIAAGFDIEFQARSKLGIIERVIARKPIGQPATHRAGRANDEKIPPIKPQGACEKTVG
jgi:ubiquinone/menaquinone biosynthesis C-methylase UbiE